MNIFEKLQNARLDLQKMNLKKSGRNNYSNYSYYELSDFLPAINELMGKYKFVSQLKIDNTLAVLSIIDSEKPESSINFTCPFVSISLKGANEVQNLGAVITYTRRYLYMNAFEIVESDQVDSRPLDHTTQPKLTIKDTIEYIEFIELLQTIKADEKDTIAIKEILINCEKNSCDLIRIEKAIDYLTKKYIKPILEVKK